MLIWQPEEAILAGLMMLSTVQVLQLMINVEALSGSPGSKCVFRQG